ncbi:molybdenum cofactor biosynthesis protein MoeA [Ignicoccus pacificus DSM 13166]|uniref:Molybdenum cofactor biosynthesis protein MoeA n=1 Tax=Ignicoccus pacificus DSM 13166 TaxID=940294 RepID=A0A977PJR7_9CREN|nr:molybdenum cofactor biosynthesis protein MoeA [Ignicoccus pacificus DSM 13166]
MRKVFKKLENVDVAFQKLVNAVPPRPPKPLEVSLHEALGYYLAEDVYSSINIPPFPRSSVDGYAVNSRSTWGASEDEPVKLKVKGKVKVGEEAKVEVGEGEAVEVDTGSMIPPGADAVVPVEYVKEVEDSILVYRAVTPGENVLWPATDVYYGELIARSGERITSRTIAALSSIGKGKVNVWKLKVAVISTGNELVEPGNPLPPGKVYDVNTFSLSARLREEGFEPIVIGVVPDDYEKLKEAILKGLEVADVVITSGSTSAGPEDMVYRVVGELGEIIVHGLAFKPGKPVMLGRIGEKPVFGLAGHPDSAYFNLEKIVIPYLKMCVKARRTTERKIKAVAASAFTPARGRRTHIPVKLLEGDRWYAFSSALSDHAMVKYSRADGYVTIPETRRAPVEVGEEVEVTLFQEPDYDYAFIGDVDVFVDNALKTFEKNVKVLPLGSFAGSLASEKNLKAVWLSPSAKGEELEVELVIVGEEGKRLAFPHPATFLYRGYREFLKKRGLREAEARKKYLHVGAYPSPQAVSYAVKRGFADFGITTLTSALKEGLSYEPLMMIKLRLGWHPSQKELAEYILSEYERVRVR